MTASKDTPISTGASSNGASGNGVSGAGAPPNQADLARKALQAKAHANNPGGAQIQSQSQAQSQAKPTVSHMLGEVTWLMSQSPLHKHFTLGDLEWMVMPAILLEQFRVFHGETTPVGFALWATLSEAAEQRLNEAAMAGAGARLRPDEWKSGDRLWLVELVAPFATEENRLNEAMVADLAQNIFPGRTFKMHVTDPLTGKREVKEIGG